MLYDCKLTGLQQDSDHLIVMSVYSYSPVQLHCGDESSDNRKYLETVSQSSSVEKHRQLNLSESNAGDPSFSVTKSAKKHLRNHSGKKSFQCIHCGKTFRCSSKLKTHMRLHSGERPFKCSECGKTFSESGHLKRHMRIHSGDKPFKCIDCGKTFSVSCSLKNHLRIHSGEKPFKCSECGRTFSRSHHLKTHLCLHSGEKPFKCGDCGKMFSESGNLKKHVQIHSGEKPFNRSDCETSGEVNLRTVTQHRVNLTKRSRCDSTSEAAVDIKVEEEQSSPSELPVHSSACQSQDNGEYKTQWSELANGTVSHSSSDSHPENLTSISVKTEYSESIVDWKLLVRPFVRLTRRCSCS